MRKLLVFAVMAACLGACQAATSQSPPLPTKLVEDGSAEHPLKIAHLHIEHLPSNNDLDHRYPHDAMRRDIPGVARLVCLVAVDGHLTNCDIREEAPAGAGFGPATIAVSEYVKLQPGLYTGKFVDFTLRWRTGG